MNKTESENKIINSLDAILNQVDGNLQNALTIYKEMFKVMIQNAPIGMYILEDGEFSYVNSRFCNLIGYEEQELIAGLLTPETLIHEDDIPLFQENINKRLLGKETNVRYRVRAIKKDGNLIFVEIHATKITKEDKTIFVGSIIDITEEVTAHKKLKENEERFKSLFYNNPDAIFTFDLDGKFTDINPGCEVLTGYSISELLDMTFTPLILSEDLPMAIHNFESAINGHINIQDLSITKKDGSQKHLNITTFPMKIDGKIVGAYGIAKDITERVEYNRKMEELAFYDSLTSLPNRRLFEDRLQQVVEYSKEAKHKTAVLFVDLDRFKFINDSLGHHLGDEFLKRVSERFRDNLRKTDTISRFAGDEFAIMLPKTSETEAIILAQRLNQVLAQPFNICGHSVSVSASIGIAFSHGNVENAAELVKNADTAMYYTKKFGKNNFTVYSEELDLNTAYKLTIEKDLKTAISNREFVLYYQPIIDLNTGKISGMESLIRWKHPEFGLLSPDTFIPISEESGQIFLIGKWVLYTACNQNKKWQEQGHPPFKISVNISTIQLQHQSFVETVEGILEETGLDSQWLELEVTESILMEDTEYMKDNLVKLKKLGVSIAIDDFGTGYTSLSYLRQFSFDRVKIDRSFINDISDGLNGKAITSTIISLAQKLNMGVIAEGIENEIQLSFLKDEQCDEGQGYYFSRPLPAEKYQLPITVNVVPN